MEFVIKFITDKPFVAYNVINNDIIALTHYPNMFKCFGEQKHYLERQHISSVNIGREQNAFLVALCLIVAVFMFIMASTISPEINPETGETIDNSTQINTIGVILICLALYLIYRGLKISVYFQVGFITYTFTKCCRSNSNVAELLKWWSHDYIYGLDNEDGIELIHH
jgi:hypothetical protein